MCEMERSVVVLTDEAFVNTVTNIRAMDTFVFRVPYARKASMISIIGEYITNSGFEWVWEPEVENEPAVCPGFTIRPFQNVDKTDSIPEGRLKIMADASFGVFNDQSAVLVYNNVANEEFVVYCVRLTMDHWRAYFCHPGVGIGRVLGQGFVPEPWDGKIQNVPFDSHKDITATNRVTFSSVVTIPAQVVGGTVV